MLKRLRLLIITILVKSIGLWCIICFAVYFAIRVLFVINRRDYDLILQLLDILKLSPVFQALLPFMYGGMLFAIIILLTGLILWAEKQRMRGKA